MKQPRFAAAIALQSYVTRLRRRGLLLMSGEALILSLSVSVIMLAATAAMAGPVVTPTFARMAFGLVVLGPLLVGGFAAYRARRLSGLSAAGLLSSTSAGLSRSLRGALELASADSDGASQELMEAHIAQVTARTEDHPVSEVLPVGALGRPRTVLPLLLSVGCAVLLMQLPALQRGLASLRHPALVRTDGTLVAPVLESATVRLLYPSYMQREPVLLKDPQSIEAPAGTTAEIVVVPRVDTVKATAISPTGPVRLGGRDGVFSGRFVIRKSGELKFQLQANSQHFEHNSTIKVVALADRIPVVEVKRPNDNATIDATVPLEVSFHAQDDEGLTAVDLVVQPPGGGEVRSRIWTPDGDGEPTDVLESSAVLLPQQAGIYPGDRFDLWIEAHDGDAVSGPNIGRSQPITLFALSDAQQLSEQLPRLKAVLDLGTISLAEQLEEAVDNEQEVGRRMAARGKTTLSFGDAVEAFVDGLRESGERARFEAEQLTAMARRVRRQQRLLQTAFSRGSYTGATRDRLHGAMVEELENDVLYLANLLAQAHVQEAQALTDELQELRKRMQALLTDLSEANTELAKQELLAELNRAEARLRELMRSMSQLASHVPSEFVNEEAMPEGGAGSAMEELRKSVQEGDMKAAARHLDRLERELSSLTESLNEGGLRFREARFGPRDKAMAEAQDRLGMLKEEQRRLAQESADKTRQVMGRSGGKDFDKKAMDKLASEVGQQLGHLDPSAMGMGDRELLDQAEQRVKDAQDALGSGDLSEAARMAAAGNRTLDRLARNLESDAKMFPGHDGKVGKNASSAADANRNMQRLRDAVDDALPRLSDHLNREDLTELQGQASAQKRTRDAAQDLREKFENGPQGMPLSPEAGRTLETVEQAMRRAEQELRRGNPQAASLSQEQAADELKELEEELAKQQEMAQQGGGGQDGRSGESAPGGKVDIPDDKDFKAPAELRRKLLDAMREDSPPGYEATVQRYFKELMR